MRALVLDGNGLAVRDVPAPEAQPGEVVVRVHACAVCQSDLHVIRDRQASLGRYADGGGHVPGHEFAGTVLAIGDGVVGIASGMHVSARPLATCGHCAACRRGLLRACPERSVVGFTRPGAFAELVAVPANAVYPLPAGLPFETAALAEPLACAYNAAVATGLQQSEWAAVIGPGPLGLFVTQVLKRLGVQVVVAGTRDERLSVAQEFGADAVCNVRRADPVEAVYRRTGGFGADASVDAVGSNEALAQAFAVTRLRGTVVLAGEPAPGTTFSLESHRFFFQEHRLVASLGAAGSFPLVLRLLAERLINAERLITHRFTLEEAPLAFEMVASRKGGVLKAVVLP